METDRRRTTELPVRVEEREPLDQCSTVDACSAIACSAINVGC
jgi:hypothetical protein